MNLPSSRWLHASLLVALFIQQTASALNPPKAEQIPQTLQAHGEQRVDNYGWLRDDQRKAPKVLDYLNAENRYTEAMLEPAAALRDTLYQEMAGRINRQDQSLPYTLDGYQYREQLIAGKEYAIYQRKKQQTNSEWEVLLDANLRAAGQRYYRMAGMEISRHSPLMAIAEDYTGRRQYRIAIQNISGGNEEIIENTSGNMAWANDGKSLFYVRNHPQTLRAWQLYRHQYGSEPSSDQLVYQEDDEGFYLSLSTSSSRQYILLTSNSTSTSEVRLINADQPAAAPELFAARQTGREYYLDHYRGQFYLRANHQSPQFGLYQTASAKEPWQVLIAPDTERELESFAVFRSALITKERHQGLSRIRQLSWDGKLQRELSFDDPSYMAWLGNNPDPDSTTLQYRYSSMTTPTSTFAWNLQNGERSLLKQQQIKAFQAQDYRSERLWLSARDGVKVPVSLVYKKSLLKPGKNPLLVYGYGAYGMSMDASFSPARLSLLDRGFVFAIVHVRGGGELGQAWYQQGKLANKQNSFNDFIDSTQGLVKAGFGQPGRLYAMGSSAGGLLVAASINQAPKLFNAVVAQVPFVDVLTTMLDPSLPLTVGEYEEWGNPQLKADYQRIKSYSPYDGVTAQPYPHLLVTSGLHDSQVQYWEPAKWVAKLRALKQGDSMLLLSTDMNAGHGGKSGQLGKLKNSAMEYSFILHLDAQAQRALAP
ncbi:S9 family peptidase [Janthinobacterium sp. B9-8]|uniref:S9 family peptidase n=1 Tax=Janthinobacterium sp. B9-8 TaxID=1236179 RepID=UPI0009E8FC8B|nr:S9 family peptidase [Janthinobacterium sp. B9-8]